MQQGGSLIGQGGYACVFSPAIPCKDIPTAQTSISVGKVFVDPIDAKEEMELVKELKTLDPDQNYFLYSTELCSFDSFGSEPDVRKCRADFSEGEVRHQTIMFDGGTTLDRFLQSEDRMPDDGWSLNYVLELLDSVFVGIGLLIENDLIHQDIKVNNIVVSSKGQVRIIDFGLLVGVQPFYEENHLFKTDYFVNPPEYMMMRPTHKLNILSVEELEHSTWAHTKTRFDVSRDAVFDLQHKKSFQKLLRDRIKCPNFESFEQFAIDGEWHKKADIYSLGLVLIFCARLVNAREVVNPMFLHMIQGMIMPHPDDRFGMATIMHILSKIKSG